MILNGKQGSNARRALFALGGTYARLGLQAEAGAPVKAIEVVECDVFDNLEALIERYLDQQGAQPTHVGISVPGPVGNGVAEFTNRKSWNFSIEQLGNALGHPRMTVVNTAGTLGVLSVPSTRLVTLHRQQPAAAPRPTAQKGYIAPGTGLGIGGLMPMQDGHWRAIESLAGHLPLTAPKDHALAQRVLGILGEMGFVTPTGEVSAEDGALSGHGLVNLYRAVCLGIGCTPEPDITPQEISRRATATSGAEHRACTLTVNLFWHFLARAAAATALMFQTEAGLYVSGGIVSRIGAGQVPKALFRDRFLASGGTMADYLRRVPVHVVLPEKPVDELNGVARAMDMDLAA